MPPRALVNDLWEGPLPEELQDLSVAEKLMITRAFTFTQLHTCTRKGNPSDRQKRIQGNTISFAQDVASLLLDALPLHPSKLEDFLLLYFGLIYLRNRFRYKSYFTNKIQSKVKAF